VTFGVPARYSAERKSRKGKDPRTRKFAKLGKLSKPTGLPTLRR